MKTKVSYILLSSVLIFSACGSKEEKSSGDEKKVESTEETVEDEGPERLKASDIDISKPIPSDVANAAIMCWEGKTIDIAGYVYNTYGADSINVDYGSFTILAGKGSNKHAVSVYLKDRGNKFKISPNDMIHIRATVSGTYFDTVVSVNNAEVIEIKNTIKTDKLNPEKEGGIFDAGELNKDVTQWNNKEITIQGDYYMTTVSKLSSGDNIRVDIKNPKSDYADVGCEFAVDPSDKLKDNREGVIITGKIKAGGGFGRVYLTDCKLVNR